MKLKIYYNDNKESEVHIMKHKGKDLYSFVNVTKNHITPCVFNTVESALEDLKNYPNIIKWEKLI